jgi:hypothetical protein
MQDPTTPSDLDRLCEMFPNLDREFLQSNLNGRNLLEAITFLVGGDCSDPPLSQVGQASSSTSSLSDTHSSLSELLEYFSSSVIDDFDSWITAEKEIWPRAVQFYKTAKVKEKRLRGRSSLYKVCRRRWSRCWSSMCGSRR